jgi:hypothetical protein
MAKVTLVGQVVDASGSFRAAKTQEASEVLNFIGPNPNGSVPEYFMATQKDSKWELKTPKGVYILTKCPSGNTWKTKVGDTTIFLNPKKVVVHLSWK